MSSNDLENKLEAIKKLIENIDLTKCMPTPWGTRSYNCPIADTGDVYGYTDLFDETGETIVSSDRDSDEDVLVDGWYQEVNLYTAAQAVNAIAEIQNILLCKAKDVKYYAKWELGVEYEYAYCSHCGHEQFANWDTYAAAKKSIGEFYKEYKFCPNCGIRMR